MLYEMLTGELPFAPSEGDGVETLLQRMRKEAYVPVTQLASRVPRFLGNIVRDCLRAKPKRRPQDARTLRQLLERRLGYLSGGDARAELCGWLWDQKIFEARDDETVVRGGAPPPPPRPTGMMWRLLIGALLFGRRDRRRDVVRVSAARAAGRDPGHDPGPHRAPKEDTAASE